MLPKSTSVQVCTTGVGVICLRQVWVPGVCGRYNIRQQCRECEEATVVCREKQFSGVWDAVFSRCVGDVDC